MHFKKRFKKLDKLEEALVIRLITITATDLLTPLVGDRFLDCYDYSIKVDTFAFFHGFILRTMCNMLLYMLSRGPLCLLSIAWLLEIAEKRKKEKEKSGGLNSLAVSHFIRIKYFLRKSRILGFLFQPFFIFFYFYLFNNLCVFVYFVYLNHKIFLLRKMLEVWEKFWFICSWLFSELGVLFWTHIPVSYH